MGNARITIDKIFKYIIGAIVAAMIFILLISGMIVGIIALLLK